MSTQPSLRIGDSERDAVAAELQEHFAHGRLTLEEFNERLDAVFAARTQKDLSQITADLPHVRSGGAPLPSAHSARASRPTSGLPATGRHGRSGALAARADAPPVGAGWAGPAWAGPGWPGTDTVSADWPGRNWSGGSRRGAGRPRAGFAASATLLAALVSWLLVYDVLLVGLRWPWSGRVGLLIAIFTVIRGLLRRIFRGSRRR